MINTKESLTQEGIANLSFNPDLVNSISFEPRRSIITDKFLKKNFSLGRHAKSDNALKSTLRYVKKHYKPSGACLTKFLFDRLPLLSWLIHYNVKKYFLKDLLSGIYVIFTIF